VARALEVVREFVPVDGRRLRGIFSRVPGAVAFGEWFMRPGVLRGLERVDRHLARQVFVRSVRAVFALDVDASLFVVM
jgi:hypothetical protein